MKKKIKKKSKSKKTRKSKKSISLGDFTKNTLKNTKDSLKSNHKKLFIPIGLDLLFFFGLGFIMGGFGSKVVELLQTAGTQIIKQSKELQSAESIWGLVQSDPVLKGLVTKAALLLILLGIAMYLWYSFVHGFIWYSLLSWKKEVNKNLYLKRFFQLNALWAIPSVIYLITNFMFTLNYQLAKNIENVPMQDAQMWANVFSIILGFMIIFSMISYYYVRNNSATKAFKKSFKAIIDYPLQLASSIAIIMVGLLILDIILENIIVQSPLTGLIIGAIVLFPIITLIRIYIIETITSCN